MKGGVLVEPWTLTPVLTWGCGLESASLVWDPVLRVGALLAISIEGPIQRDVMPQHRHSPMLNYSDPWEGLRQLRAYGEAREGCPASVRMDSYFSATWRFPGGLTALVFIGLLPDSQLWQTHVLEVVGDEHRHALLPLVDSDQAARDQVDAWTVGGLTPCDCGGKP